MTFLHSQNNLQIDQWWKQSCIVFQHLRFSYFNRCFKCLFLVMVTPELTYTDALTGDSNRISLLHSILLFHLKNSNSSARRDSRSVHSFPNNWLTTGIKMGHIQKDNSKTYTDCKWSVLSDPTKGWIKPRSTFSQFIKGRRLPETPEASQH